MISFYVTNMKWSLKHIEICKEDLRNLRNSRQLDCTQYVGAHVTPTADDCTADYIFWKWHLVASQMSLTALFYTSLTAAECTRCTAEVTF